MTVEDSELIVLIGPELTQTNMIACQKGHVVLSRTKCCKSYLIFDEIMERSVCASCYGQIKLGRRILANFEIKSGTTRNYIRNRLCAWTGIDPQLMEVEIKR